MGQALSLSSGVGLGLRVVVSASLSQSVLVSSVRRQHAAHRAGRCLIIAAYCHYCMMMVVIHDDGPPVWSHCHWFVLGHRRHRIVLKF